MVTVLKFPIYIEITSDNVDRKVISDAATQILYPQLLKYFSNAKYRMSVLDEFRDATKVDSLDVKLLTEFDLFKERNK